MGETAPLRQHGESEFESPTPAHTQGPVPVPAFPGAVRPVPFPAGHDGSHLPGGRGTAGAPVLMTLHLPASVDAVPRARHALRTVLAGERARPGERATPRGSDDEPLQVLELLVSELVTNAVRHAPQSTEVTVQLLWRESVFRLAVTDAGGPLRRPGRQARASDENGRGLLLVEALADSWGSYPVAGGKVVWCDVPTA